MLAQRGNKTEFPDIRRLVLGVGIRLGPKSDGQPGSPKFENTTFMEEAKDRLSDHMTLDDVEAEIVWDEF